MCFSAYLCRHWIIDAVITTAIVVACCVNLQAAHPIVPGVERFYAATAPSPLAAEILAGELNCVSCHAGSDSIANKAAPNLAEVATRIKPAYLQKFIANPHDVKPGTTMPDVFSGQSDAEKKAQVEALTHYLVSLSPAGPEQQFPSIGAHSYGEKLFHQVGCAACHGSQKEGAETLATSKPLGNLLEKYTLPSLTEFIRNPLHTRPSGRMPSLNLTGGEAKYIASFLLKGLPEVANIQYSYYEGNWNDIPDFGKETPQEVGGTTKIDVSLRKRDDQFGLRFEGFIDITEAGDYTFQIGSDDGSRLSVDGKAVVDFGGIHSHIVKSGKVTLKAGYHAILVDYFEQGGEQSLEVLYEGPGVPKQPLAAAMTTVKAPPEKENLAFEVNTDLIAIGRNLFSSLGCNNCHKLNKDQAVQAKPLTSCDSSKGCLAENPSRAPSYSLNQWQRKTLALLTSSEKNNLDVSQQIHKKLVTFNCYGCHQRGKIGGVEQARNELFEGTQQEMGDEGRIPPQLTGIGAKLTDKWLDGILANGANDRPYMHTRMPKFGQENVGDTRAMFTATDKLDAEPKVTFSAPLNKVKGDGRRMVGARGFGCIKCHSFGQFKATGIQSIDMKTMSERLREDWFRQYVRNPQKFRQGTRMPSAWPVDTSLLPDLLDGKSSTQIAAVWSYLSDGTRAKIPEGLVTGSMELIPYDEAIIYRNFIQDAGPRAVGVGYPEGVNIAFDANNLRLALAWQGRFIDASKHWSGRGQGFQGPLGESVVKFPNSPSFAVLENDAAPWPTETAKQLGYKFRGYRLTSDQRPTLLYQIGEASVADYFDTTASENSVLSRKFRVTGKGKVWLRAAAGTIEKTEDGWFKVGEYSTQIIGAQPELRGSGNQQELLVPIDLS
ncbi:MAG: cytochrome c2, partial [Pirellulaceae bacterium]